MYSVIKNKGKMVEAYQLGSDNGVIKDLIKEGKLRDLGDGHYEVYSQEAINGAAGGERAEAGDWIKIDSTGSPYPNKKEFFEANHRKLEGDSFEQIPKPIKGWDDKLEMCPEVEFLVEKKGLIIDPASSDQRYTAELWGTTEVAAKDAMLIFYSVSYDDAGKVIDADFNFVERKEFEKTYSIIDRVPQIKRPLETEGLTKNTMANENVTRSPDQTDELHLEFVQEQVPEINLTPVYISSKRLERDDWPECVKQDGLLLRYLYTYEKTYDLCLAAVKQNGKAIEYVPQEYRTSELCYEAVSRYGLALSYVPESLRTPELCLEAVKQNGLALEYIPREKQTLPMVLAALHQNPDSCRYLADEFRTKSVFEHVNNKHNDDKYLPEFFFNHEPAENTPSRGFSR